MLLPLMPVRDIFKYPTLTMLLSALLWNIANHLVGRNAWLTEPMTPFKFLLVLMFACSLMLTKVMTMSLQVREASLTMAISTIMTPFLCC